LAVKLVQTYWPGQGFYAVAALAGLSDVDAITLSMAEYAKSDSIAQPALAGAARVAATSITIAAIANTLVKCGLVLFLGSWALSWRVLIATGLVIFGGGLVTAAGLYLAG
jgi:uncharacterized membrane protein (DUF4010 family)